MSATWKPLIVGVDTSAAAGAAAEFAVGMAAAVESRCYLVHATPEAWPALAMSQWPEQVEHMKASIAARARRTITAALAASVPEDRLARLLIGFGRAPVVFAEVVRDTGAELIVLGGKRHSMLGRWFGGSTCHDLIRTAACPVLVTRDALGVVRRVLAAVDLSGAAPATLDAATRIATAFDAELRVMSVLEPLPSIPEVAAPPLREYQRLFEEHLERDVWPLISYPGASTVLRHGAAAAGISQEATEWSADLVVVGSHGKSWLDRVLIGSVTERLLNHLPASLLVVPVGRGARVSAPGAQGGRAITPSPRA